MLNGPRGCGKSMIFRYLLPDCQCLQHGVSLERLQFFGVLVSIKNTAPNLTEFHRLDDRHAKIILNEHVLTVFVASKVFKRIGEMLGDDNPDWGKAAIAFFNEIFIKRLSESGWEGEQLELTDGTTPTQVFSTCETVCDALYRHINEYAKCLSFPGRDGFAYKSAICDYLGFLHPVLTSLRSLPFMPKGRIYLLIDDADYLSHTQTRVLNSWVATRTQQDVSIKISTQLRYKTFATVTGMPIQTPHDYQEINIADTYTSGRSRYPSRIEQILERRLKKANINVAPRDFFPPDRKQEQAIQKLAEELRDAFPEKGRGYRAGDDAARYARPEYIKRLGGTSKQTSKYSYAGFEQLVHISSGIVRYVLEPAAQMFDEESALHGTGLIKCISTNIQDEVIRREAENLMFTEFDKIAADPHRDAGPTESADPSAPAVHQRRTEELRNLIKALGGTFYQKLISLDAERRVFSVAISGVADRELLEVFELGVRYGYFHRSSIGNKDGTGRTRLYILTRRLAPHFKLDPSSFAGYLWATNERRCCVKAWSTQIRH